MFGHKTAMKVEVEHPEKMAGEIGDLISLYHGTRKGLLTYHPSFGKQYPELYRPYLELKVRGSGQEPGH